MNSDHPSCGLKSSMVALILVALNPSLFASTCLNCSMVALLLFASSIFPSHDGRSGRGGSHHRLGRWLRIFSFFSVLLGSIPDPFYPVMTNTPYTLNWIQIQDLNKVVVSNVTTVSDTIVHFFAPSVDSNTVASKRVASTRPFDVAATSGWRVDEK